MALLAICLPPLREVECNDFLFFTTVPSRFRAIFNSHSHKLILIYTDMESLILSHIRTSYYYIQSLLCTEESHMVDGETQLGGFCGCRG